MVSATGLNIRQIVESAAFVIRIPDGLRDAERFLVERFSSGCISSVVISVSCVVCGARRSKLISGSNVDFLGLITGGLRSFDRPEIDLRMALSGLGASQERTTAQGLRRGGRSVGRVE